MVSHYEDVDESGGRLAKNFILVSKTSILLSSIVVVALLVAEGLIIGLVTRPECEPYIPAPQPTTKPPATQKPPTDRPVIPTLPTLPTIDEEAGPWTNIRLPTNLIPEDYDVSLRPILTPDLLGRYFFKGSMTVRYWCREPTKYIIMHSWTLNYTLNDMSLKVFGGANVPIKSMRTYLTNQYLIVETDSDCEKDVKYEFTIAAFEGELDEDLDGLYKSDYYNSEGEYVVLATTQFEATGARKAFPCFDEPALKANFTITLWHRTGSGYDSLSNMPVEDTKTDIIDGQSWTGNVFEKTPRMSTYLLAMVVSDFTYVDNSTRDGIRTRVYARPSYISYGDADYAAVIAPAELDYFIDYLRFGYPLPKSDQIGIPDFAAGAMENWGLVTYRESYLMRNDSTTSDRYKIVIANVIAHELAHQWFGNIVSPAWWDYIWLNEGFATYFSYVGEEGVKPNWKATDRFIIDEMRGALSVDARTSSRPLVQHVETPQQISLMFDTISYNKGGCILRMINGFMGEENFINALNEYLNAHAYSVATQDDLFFYLSKHSDALNLPTDLNTILETWTLQMGFPVVTVTDLDPITNAFTVSQEYFLTDPDAVPQHTNGSLKYGYQWYIPFTYKKGSNIGGIEETVWLSPYETITLEDSDFILGNFGATGFYRVNYDRDSWDRIAAKLDSEFYQEIPVASRSQLLDDAFTLASADRLLITAPLEIALYLHRDDSYIPWKTFMDNIKYFEYMLGRTEVFGTLKSYILELAVPSLYEKYGWDNSDNRDSTLIDRQLRAIGIEAACYYGNPECVGNATMMFQDWMKSPGDWSLIPASFRSDVLCAAIRNGGITEWNFAWERFLAGPSSEWQVSLRYGMACSKDPWILSRYLEYARTPDLVPRQNSIVTMEYVGREEYGRDVAWGFMVDNWDSLVEQYGAVTLSNLISSITRRFSTEYDLKLLQDFKENYEVAGALVAVNQAIEQTNTNIKWRNRNEDLLTGWFYENVDEIV